MEATSRPSQKQHQSGSTRMKTDLVYNYERNRLIPFAEKFVDDYVKQQKEHGIRVLPKQKTRLFLRQMLVLCENRDFIPPGNVELFDIHEIMYRESDAQHEKENKK
jgi:hypothetical protein